MMRPFDYERDFMTRWQRLVRWMSNDALAAGAFVLCVITILYLIAHLITLALS